jgi:hypothetical protein
VILCIFAVLPSGVLPQWNLYQSNMTIISPSFVKAVQAVVADFDLKFTCGRGTFEQYKGSSKKSRERFEGEADGAPNLSG